MQLLISDCLRERWSTFLRCILSFYSHYNRPESRSSVQLQQHQARRSRIAKMLTDSESFTPGYNMHSSKWHFWYQRLTLHKWGKQICMWILVLMCLCLPRLPWPTFPFSYTHRIDMDAIKKKMQSMKVEKDNAMDRADVCEQAAKDAKVYFLEEIG